MITGTASRELVSKARQEIFSRAESAIPRIIPVSFAWAVSAKGLIVSEGD